MAKIFVSYSRVDSQFVEQFIPILRRVYGKENVWYDDDIHGGADWWQMILREIGKADIFIYLLSNDSLESSYCRSEMREALRLHKAFLPLMIRPRTDIDKAPQDLARIIRRTNWIDLTRGVKDTQATASLFGSINTLLDSRPSSLPPPAAPDPIEEPPVVDKKPVPPASPSSNRFWPIAGGMLMLLAGLVAVYFLVLRDTDEEASPTPTTSADVNLLTEEGTEVALEPSSTRTPTLTRTSTRTSIPTGTPTQTPTFSETEIEASVQAQMGQIQTEAAQTIIAQETATSAAATGFAQMTVYAQETDFAHATETATLYTFTPTPDARKTAEARLTETQAAANEMATQAFFETGTAYAYETETQTALNATATATLWTDTPTATLTPSDTPTPTPTNTPTMTFTPSLTPTLTQREKALKRAEEGVSSNDEWTPYVEEINGVEMVLVPKGCFMMGSEDGAEDEKPVHEQCFDEPFWMDKTEVTRAVYEECVEAGACEEKTSNQYLEDNNQPINAVSWFQARDYCEWRGARLPTEREWEYAARGPDNLIYPWGNEFVAENVVYRDNTGSVAAEVGSRPGGASWVGAMDMSGNVWEWVSSLYDIYPYTGMRESNINANSLLVLRGGSFSVTANYLRAAARGRDSPSDGYNDYGVRCARSYEAE